MAMNPPACRMRAVPRLWDAEWLFKRARACRAKKQAIEGWPRSKGSENTEIHYRNPAGIEPRLAKVGSQPEANIASSTREGGTKRMGRAQKPCD